MMKRPTGFTLVELLVVIAIIALLISILAPSLRTVKDIAKEMLCTTNQRAIGQAMVLYAETNRGCIMPYRADSAAAVPELPSGMCLAFQGGGVVSADGLLPDRRTFGVGYANGVFSPVSIMYCPSAVVGWADYKQYPEPWGSAASPSFLAAGITAHVRTTYMYNPNCSGVKYVAGLRLAAFPGDTPVASDLMYDYRISHAVAGGVKWYMVFPDTHVEPRSSKAAVSLVSAGVFDAFNQWGEYNLLYEAIIRQK
jgi:prepilin-type N-terminal cleavage/methylation domain-containing protein